ncbi:hypothetical protein BD410DRAFT_784945 [Rickenella mellea]|uniref:F-box domain-containing protein n=1 Tax=Rickenella mellea TaxID=50990 RepID=A0A4Y7QBT4_9AGAM|nr:hypothetical protein BD410DRAFT_784945 [Rickenella mellea]
MDTNDHSEFIPPICRLNTELLVQIFVCLVEDIPSEHRFTPRFPQPKSTEAPLILGRVNTLWRHVALWTPRLWENVEILYREPSKSPPGDILNRFLSRSGARPLSIAVSFDPTSEHFSQTESLFSEMARVMHRWRRIYLTTHLIPHVHDFIRLIGATPLLESVECLLVDIIAFRHRRMRSIFPLHLASVF